MSTEEKSCADCAHGVPHPNHEGGAAVWCRGNKSPRIGSFTQPEFTCPMFTAKADAR